MLLNKIIDRNGVSVVSNQATHPGVLLKDEIEFRKLVKSSFAKEIGLKPNHLSEIFVGKRNISPLLAIKLQMALHIPAENWLSLQMHYDLSIARQMISLKKGAGETSLLKRLPFPKETTRKLN
jgi:antitoxin HigA-1